jgi:hypothetical protein
MFKKQEYLCDPAAFDCETISAVSFDNKSIAGHRFESLRYQLARRKPLSQRRV